MVRRILVIERSPLARNIYSMILARLDEIELLSMEASEPIDEIRGKAEKASLIIMSGSALSDLRDEFYKMSKSLSDKAKFPCVFFVSRGQAEKWQDFAKLKGVEVLEKPFSPDELLARVKGIWGLG